MNAIQINVILQQAAIGALGRVTSLNGAVSPEQSNSLGCTCEPRERTGRERKRSM